MFVVRTRILVGLLLISSGLVISTSGQLSAEEPKSLFLSALKNRKYFDTAADYIEQLQKIANLPPAEKLSLTYEQGEILWQKSLATRDPKVRDEVLALAQTKLQEFLAAGKDHPNAPEALISLARISHFRGLNIRKLAQKGPADQRPAEFVRAREQLGNAKKHLVDAEKQLVGFLTPIRDKLKKKEALTSEDEEKKDKYFPALLDVRLLQGESQYELAMTFEPKSKEYVAALEASNKEFAEAYDKYAGPNSATKFGAGYKARIKQARNLILLGKPGDAASAAWEVFAAENIPSSIFKEALRTALEANYMEKKVDKKVWTQIEDAMKDVPRISTAIDAEIYYFAALCGEQAKTTTPAEKDKVKVTTFKYVRDLLRYRAPFEYFAETRELAKRLGIKSGTERRNQSFADLVLEAKQSYSQYAEAFQKWSDFQGPDEERKNLEEERDGLHDAVYDSVVGALQVAPRDAKPEDLSFLRFVLSSYHSINKNFYEAIIWGEATATGSNDGFAQRAAGSTIKSLQLLRSEVQDVIAKELQKTNSEITRDSREVKLHPEVAGLNARLRRSAEHLIRNWSNSAEADSARLIFITSELDDQNYASALKMIEQMKIPTNPKDPDLRATAELMLGSISAQRYLSQKYGKNVDPSTVAAADKLKPYAITGLKKTLLRLLETNLDERGVTAAYLYLLIQLREDLSDPDILKLLDHPKQGLSVKIQKNSDDIPEKSSFDIARTVFQVYLLSGNVPSAVKMIAQLEAEAKDDPELKKMINSIILQASRELDKDIREYREKNQLDRVKKLTTAYRLLLTKLAERADGLDFGGLYGISESYIGLAEVDPESKNDSLKAAEEIYSKIIKRAADDKNFASPNVMQIIQVKQIGLMRSRGDFENARKQLLAMLKDKPANIVAQKEAALTLEQWAETKTGKEQYELYAKAINGDPSALDSKQKPLIWGWSQIWRTMYQQPAFRTPGPGNNVRDLFFEARYHNVLCRLKQAQGLPDTDDRKPKVFNSGKDIIRATYIDVDRELGSPTRKAEFEKALKGIQAGLKQPVIGLKEFETAPDAGPDQPAKAAVSAGK